MNSYLFFLGIVIIQWILLFPKGKINLNGYINCKQKKFFVILVCIELIFFVGIRATDIGADTTVYINALNYYKKLPNNQILGAKLVYPFDFEIGYFMLVKICAWFSMEETTFLCLIACIIYIPIFKFILKYSENPLLSILTYFAFGYFEYSLGIFRQMIALSIIIIGFNYLKKRNFIKYLLIVLLAMTFHTTAIIILPLYWIYQIDIKNKLKWIIALEIFIAMSSRITILLIMKVFAKYSNYIGGKYDVQGGSYIMLLILNIVLIMGYIILVRENNNGEKNENLLISINAIAIAIFLQIIGYSMEIFGRIVPYYSIYLLLIIPIVANHLFEKNRLFIHMIAIILLMLIAYVTIKDSVIVPYSTIFMTK